ncbi:MAG: VWA domain-containing protein [Acidobacteriaceae bacterium]|nr:VWA domain-containing protein [Acidobacteriaceae bacterium]
MFATVRDKDGKVVRDLAKEDFSLLEDGRPQTIQYFSRQSDLPLTLGLLVDTSMSERRMLGTERDASYSFLEKVLRPGSDKAFLIHFDHDVELLQDLTSSRERLEKALALLDRPSWKDDNGSQGGGNGGGNPNGNWGDGGRGGYGRHRGGSHGGGTAFYDAVYLAADDLLKKQTGRKALIMLTDGEDNASKISLPEAIGTVQRADTLGYAIRIADDEQSFNRGFGGAPMGRHGGGMGRGGSGGPYGRSPREERPDGKKILQQISRETGGAYFEVSKKKSVDQIYSEIEEELRNQYSIGYTPDRALSEGGYRKIQLMVKGKKYTVQAREGYYAEWNSHQS